MLFLFADDTKCLYHPQILSVSKKNSLDSNSSSNSSLQFWNLLFSLSKIFLPSFRTKFLTSYNISSFTIPRVDTFKDLGIIVSSNLSWDAHYNEIISKPYKVPFPCKIISRPKHNYIFLLSDLNFSTVQLSGNHT